MARNTRKPAEDQADKVTPEQPDVTTTQPADGADTKPPATEPMAGASDDPPAVNQADAAAAARRDAYENVTPANRGMVDALLAERRGYEQREMNDLVDQVDEQLRFRGYNTGG